MDYNNNQAIYLQIADFFIEKILLKKYNNGDRIPSIRETAVRFEVNPNTVMRAYNYLQDSEIIFNKRGVGYFIAIDGYQRIKELKRKEFFDIDVPQFFNKLNMLNIDFEKIKKLYKKL